MKIKHRRYATAWELAAIERSVDQAVKDKIISEKDGLSLLANIRLSSRIEFQTSREDLFLDI